MHRGTELGRPVRVLLVEDNPGDVVLTREGLKDGKIHITMDVVGDGQAALDFLRRRPPYTEAQRPDVVLLDLNLPGKDGREVLHQIRNDPQLETLPVVILTMSDDESDIQQAYKLRANCYITKPVDFEQFVKIVRQIDSFWFTIVQLPAEK